MKNKILGYGVSPVIALTGALYGAPALANELRLEEVIVSAQRRDESLQDVPIAVTAVDAEAMEVARVEDISNIAALTPSVKFTSTNNPASSANVIIRGVGTVGNTRSFEGAVGVFYDGVYRTRAGAALESFLDVGSLQILKGAQGTLFGKNTTAGAILVESTQPVMEEGLTGNYNIGIGDYNLRKATGALNLGLSDTSALRVAVIHNEREGFMTDASTGDDLDFKDTQAIKVQWKSDLTDSLTAHVIVDSLKSETDCCYATTDVTKGAVTPIAEGFALARGETIPTNSREASLNSIGDVENTDEGITLKLSYDGDMGQFNSVTARRDYKVDQQNLDADFHPADLFGLNETFDSEFFSQEFTFNTEVGDSGDLLLGLFYSKEDILINRDVFYGQDLDPYADILLGFDPDLLAAFGDAATIAATLNADPGLWSGQLMLSEVESRAAFAHLTYDLSDNLTGIAGIRYSEDKKDADVSTPVYNPPAVGLDTFVVIDSGPNGAFTADFEDDALSGVLGLQYALSDEAMTYLTFNRGFKSGGVILDVGGAGLPSVNPWPGPNGDTGVDPTYESETTDAVELGLKASYWDGRATTNVAAFYNEITDIQIAQFVGLLFTVLNSDSAETYGLEIENTFLLSEGLTLRTDLNWLPHAEYGEDANASAVLSNERMLQAPKLTGNIGFNYETEISSDFGLALNAQYQYSGSRRTSSNTLDEDGSFGLINASV